MPAGRPTKMTDETVGLLLQAFAWGCTDAEACTYAGINKSTLYAYCQENPEFSDRKETLKNMPTMKAKRIIDSALDEGDVTTAHKVIDRKEGTKVKQELSGPDGSPIETNQLIRIEFVNP